jgi:hypothetical protein
MGFNLDELEFFETEDGLGPAKATVHKTGKLGFSKGANTLIDFDKNKYFKIGRKKEADDEKTDVLFLIPIEESKKDEFSFTVIKAGGYYSLKTKRLLNQLKIDYRSESVIFEIDEGIDDESKYFKLTRRKKRSN